MNISSFPASSPPASGQLLTFWRWLSGTLCVLMLLTVVLSAFIRLAQSGLVCNQWLACTPGHSSDTGNAQALATLVPLARQTHRVLATVLLALSLALALGLTASKQQLGTSRPARLGFGVFGLGLSLAALGIIGRNSSAPAVMLGNLLGGLFMLTLCWQLVLALQAARQAAFPSAAWRRTARWTLPMLWLQVATGGWVSVQASALDCKGLLACLHSPMSGWLAHQLGAWALAAAWVSWVWTAWRHQHLAGLAVIGLFVLQGLLGYALAPPALLPALAHNLLAALMLALLTGLSTKP